MNLSDNTSHIFPNPCNFLCPFRLSFRQATEYRAYIIIYYHPTVQKDASFFVQGCKLFLSYSRSMFKKVTPCQESKDASPDVMNV